MHRFFREIGRSGILILLGLFFIVLSGWGFIELADEVVEGETAPFDRQIIAMLHNPEHESFIPRPDWLVGVARDITSLGSFSVLTLIVTVVTGYLFLQRRYRSAVLILLVAVSGGVLSTLLKALIIRERPDVARFLIFDSSSSFPSGHTLLSAVIYPSLGAMLISIEERRSVRIFTLGIALLLTLLIGLSRVYLGAHYPTDVLAGWTMGLAWGVFWWVVAEWWKQRGETSRAS